MSKETARSTLNRVLPGFMANNSDYNVRVQIVEQGEMCNLKKLRNIRFIYPAEILNYYECSVV